METNSIDFVSLRNETCAIFTEKTTADFVTNVFLSSSENPDIKADYELLHLNILREASEMYFTNAMKNSSVCENIDTLSKVIFNKDSWNNVITYLERKTDKYLVFAATRTISAIMHNFSLPMFKQRLSIVIESILKTTDFTIQNNLFELLASLLDYNNKITYNVHSCQCEKVVACTVSSLEDIFSCICETLSSYWDTFVETFLETGSPNINFLHMWKTLSEKNLSEHLSSVFLNEDLAINFLSIAVKLPPISLRLYVDIIAQIFCSSLKSGTWKCSQTKVLEKTVMSAISLKCLDLLPLREVPLSFCSSINRGQSMSQVETSNINVTLKNIVFVILNLLTEFTNVDFLCEVLHKVFEFISLLDVTWVRGSTYCWAIDSFIEYDDLLFGVMFASLKIYCKLKDQDLRQQECNPRIESYVEEFNPHKTFIKFLQQIGWDHNELLSFLLSDETCCLVYLLWYLKLLLAEWPLFVQAHECLLSEKYEHELLLKCMVPSTPSTKQSNQKLVLYSSSSSSDEESGQELVVVDKKNEISEYLKKRASETIYIFKNLKQGIQKLVDVREFPYKVEPLLKLLKRCSDKSVLFT